MPNHIKNRLRFSGDQKTIKSLIDRFSTFYPKTESKTYDNHLIYAKGKHQYGWLNPKDGSFRYRNDKNDILKVDSILPGYKQQFEKKWTRFPDFAKIVPPPNNDAYNDIPDQQTVRNDPDNWYNWNTKNWGTKWNSYSCEKKDGEYFFETAWGGVPNLIGVIASEYPNVKIEYDYADEDTGSNVGKFLFENGIGYNHHIENGSKKAYELAFELRPHYKDNFELKYGKYVYKEDE